MVLVLALASAFVLAADNAVIAPQPAASHRPRTTTYGAESITIPRMLSYQGKLTDTLGQPVPDGDYTMMFQLYPTPSGGSPFWSETKLVTVKKGLFSVLLGSTTPIDSMPSAGTVYLAMSVAGGPELAPRVQIVSAAYAYKADTANYALASAGGGGTVTSVSQATGIVCSPNPITTSGTVRLDTAYSNNLYIQNQAGVGQNAYFQIAGTGQAAQFHGVAASNGVPGIYGAGGSYAWGVYGSSAHPSYVGVYGDGGTTSTGTYGYAKNGSRFGVEGWNTDTLGTGMLGVGCNQSSYLYLSGGSGGAFNGKYYGAYGHATATSGTGGYFDNAHGTYARIAYYNGSTEYKILGSGTVSTIMGTRAGRKALFAPEMPEAYFEDAGEGQLANGHCRINLEKLFSDCVTVDAEHPLKAFVQLEDDCKGIYVKKDATGFDVYELQGGTSNARFSWRVLAKWKGNENVRLPDAPGPEPTRTVENLPPVEGKATTATQPRPVPGLK
jgi:hypothetical protein